MDVADLDDEDEIPLVQGMRATFDLLRELEAALRAMDRS